MPVPQAAGRITYRKKDSGTYVEYLIENIYDPAVKYARPKRKAIGKLSEGAPGMMQPNENFRRYFPEVEFPEEKEGSRRSSCLRIGAYIVIRKVIEEYHLPELLGEYFEAKDVGLFLDFWRIRSLRKEMPSSITRIMRMITRCLLRICGCTAIPGCPIFSEG